MNKPAPMAKIGGVEVNGCPKCGSRNVSLNMSNQALTVKCLSCGHFEETIIPKRGETK